MATTKKSALHQRLPAFIPPDLASESPRFKWRIGSGVLHMGRPHTADALYRKLGKNNTYCGSLALLAGIYAWGVARFAAVRDLTPFLGLYDVMFLVMEPERFLDTSFDALDRWKLDATHPYDDALSDLKHLALQAVWPGQVLDRGGAAPNVYQMVHLVRHLLGPAWRKPFDRWLNGALERCIRAGSRKGYVAKVGHVARARTWGRPLPPRILETDIASKETSTERAQFIETTNWERNPFFDRGVGRFAKLSAATRSRLRRIGVQSLADANRVGLTEVKSATGMGFMVVVMLRLELADKGLMRTADAKKSTRR